MEGASHSRIIRSFVILLVCSHLLVSVARAQAVRDLPGFHRNTLPRNDDGSTGAIPIGFSVNFFGKTYSALYVNNNGNVTFDGPLETYVPFGLSATNLPIIAAFFADIDTRSSDTEPVTFGNDRIDGYAAFGVDYFRAGYYNNHADRLNHLQLILIDRSDTGAGNFDIEFDYKQVLWDLGDAGRGLGRGDVSAVVGFSNGTRDRDAIYELAGSMQNGALLDSGAHSLIRGMLNSTVPGRYIFQARSGTFSVLPGGGTESSWSLHLVEPARASVDTPVKLVAALRKPDGSSVASEDLRTPAEVKATIDGMPITLENSGTGQYSATVVFRNTGSVTVPLSASVGRTNLSGQGAVEVEGSFVYTGGPLDIDLGVLREGSESCRPLRPSAQQGGSVSVRLELLRQLAAGHRLELRAAGRILATSSGLGSLNEGESTEVCLVTDKRAPSSIASGEPWLRLIIGQAGSKVELRLRWQVNGLSLWQRWAWLFGLIALLLVIAFVVYGYVKPDRFSRSLALTFVPEYEELDEATPQPLSQWRGVKIGWYRSARACLHPSYRISGKPAGALAILTAVRQGFTVTPGDGTTLNREMEVAEWQELRASASPGRRGAIYRIGDRGPFFRVIYRA